MLAFSFKIRQYVGFSVWLLGRDGVEEMTPFVHRVYHRRFRRHPEWHPAAALASMFEDDRATSAHSDVLCAFSDQGAPLATIRAIRRVADAPLPVERDFPVDLTRALASRSGRVADIFEIGRLAKDDEAVEAARLPNLGVVDALFAEIIRRTSRSPDNVWTAALDDVVLGMLRAKGFPFVDLGAATTYLGSSTTPVFLPVREWLTQRRRAAPQRAVGNATGAESAHGRNDG